MNNIEFSYKGTKTIIQCNSDEIMKDIIQKFLVKIQVKQEDVYFLYNGEKLNEELSFYSAANEIDKKRNQICLIANTKNEEPDKSLLKKSKYVICPECKENTHISIKNYKICLSECKNNHLIEDIPFQDFENTQYIDESEIKCGECQKSKKESYQNLLYICLTCKNNLCSLCRSKHEKSHNIIEYSQKDFICQEHFDNFTLCCSDCQIDICSLCESEHSKYKTITYGSILPKKDELEKSINNSEKILIEFKENVNKIISKLNDVIKNIDEYFNIYKNIINNFDARNKNYIILKNINDINVFNNDFMNKLNNIINDTNINNKFKLLMEILEKIEYKEVKKTKEKESDKNDDDKDEIEMEKDNFLLAYDNITGKYENLDIEKYKKLKKLKSIKTEYNIGYIKILKDGRILCDIYDDYKEDNNKINKICVYNIENEIICDISYKLDYYIKYLFQMADDNIMTWGETKFEIFKIKEKYIEKINSYSQEKDYEIKLFKLFDNTIIYLNGYKCAQKFKVYKYENEDLKFCGDFETEFYEIVKLYGVNQDEIAIYHIREGFFGKSTYITFYNIINKKECKSLKIYGKKEYCFEMHLVQNTLINFYFNFILIDLNTYKLIKPKLTNFFGDLFSLNDGKFIIYNNIYKNSALFEVQSNEVKLLEKKKN